MASIEKRVAAAVLKKIRARRGASSVSEGGPPPDCSGPVAPARLRTAQFSDFRSVAELKTRWGLSPDSSENWERLWLRNPALAHAQFERPIGWVLEVNNRVVGYLGNISLLYRYRDQTLTAVSGSGLVVEPAYRALSVSLVAAFYRQKSVDLYLTTSAVEAVAKIAKAFKSDPLPQADYDTVLFWVLKTYPFAQALMKKLKINSTFSPVGGVLGSFLVGADRVLRRRSPRPISSALTVDEIDVKQVGDEFQTFWIEKLKERPRLLTDRSPAVLRWHFDIPGDRGRTRILRCSKEGEFLGYAVLRSDLDAYGLLKSIIADLLVKCDDPAVVRALFVEAYDRAKSEGSYVLEVLGFPQDIRRVCLEWNPYERRYPSCPFYYKATDPTLHKTLSDGMVWYASPFDGDTSLIRPSYSSLSLPLNVPRVLTSDPGDNAAPGITAHEHTNVC